MQVHNLSVVVRKVNICGTYWQIPFEAHILHVQEHVIILSLLLLIIRVQFTLGLNEALGGFFHVPSNSLFPRRLHRKGIFVDNSELQFICAYYLLKFTANRV